MNKIMPSGLRVIRSQEMLMFLVMIISSLSLAGWVIHEKTLASYSLNYIPIAPSSALIFIILTIVFFLSKNFRKYHFGKLIGISLISFVIVFCFFIILNYFFSFTWDIENIFISNPEKLGHIPTGHMSPVTAFLFILFCICLFIKYGKNSPLFKYIGGSLTLFLCIVSTILLLGYLYNAPLLYTTRAIPVALPTAICFLLFSITFLRSLEWKYWTFNLIRSNEFTISILKSFLPLTIFIVIFSGYIDSTFTFNDRNPALASVLICIFVIIITTIIVVRISWVLGNKLNEKEKALEESKEKFRTITENSADAIFILNQQGKYVYTNKEATLMLGFTPEEMITKTMADLTPPGRLEEYIKILNKIISDGKYYSEIELLKKDGSIISTDLNSVLFPDGLIYGSCRDITDRNKAAQLIKENAEKLVRLNLDKDRFISILGHDLKSPVNNLIGLSGLLSENVNQFESAEIQEITKNINKSAGNTGKLLEDILLWARTQQGQLPFKPKYLRLRDIYTNILGVCKPNAEAKDITITYSSTDPIIVFADSEMLKTVLRNLLSNAIKFTGHDGTINIKATESSDQVTISVSDCGIGISPDNIVKLFDITQCLTTKGTDGETGTGLGLLLCKEFVEKHGGNIHVESEPGKGTEFKFTLPRHHDF